MSNTSLLGAYGNSSGDGFMFRNRIINGSMQINQRYAFETNATFSSQTGPYFFTDRWFGSQTGDGINDEIWLQTRTIGAGELVGRHHHLRIRQYKASGFDGGRTRICTILDSENISDLRGQTVTLSFYHRAAAAFSAFSQNWLVKVNYDTNDTTITSNSAASSNFESVGTNLIDQVFRTPAQGVSDNWVRSSYSFVIPSNAERLSVVFYNFGNTTNNAAFDLTNVQLEEGAIATPFERRPFGLELFLCQRYYEVVNIAGGYIEGQNTGYLIQSYAMKVTKRATPSSVTSSGQAYYSGGTGGVGFTPTILSATTDRCRIGANSLTNCNGFSDGLILVSAEL